MHKPICEAVVSYLNDPLRSFTLPPNAARTNLPIYQLEKIGKTVITEVFPVLESWSREDRDFPTVRYGIGIAIRRRVANLLEEDATLMLAHEVRKALSTTKGTMGGALFEGFEDGSALEFELLAGESVLAVAILANYVAVLS